MTGLAVHAPSPLLAAAHQKRRQFQQMWDAIIPVLLRASPKCQQKPSLHALDAACKMLCQLQNRAAVAPLRHLWL